MRDLAQPICPRGKNKTTFLVSGTSEVRLFLPDGSEDIIYEDDVCLNNHIIGLPLKPDEVIQEGCSEMLFI